MIRKKDDCRVEERFEMRGGKGTIRIAHMFEPGREIRSQNRLCARLVIEPGNSIGFHRHDGEEELFVIMKGRARIDDNGQISEVAAGDAVLTGGGAGHAIENIGDETLEVLAVISKFPE